MNRSHVIVIIMSSVALAAGVIAWLCVLPDGTRHTLRREEHVFISLCSSLIGGISIYIVLLTLTSLHALRSRWPLRLFIVPSLFFVLLNIGPIFGGLSRAEEAARGPQQSLDNLWGLLLSVGLLLLYLLAGVCLLAWAVWQQYRRPFLSTG